MIIMPVNMAGNRYRPPARYHRQNMIRHCMAVRGSDFWQGAKSRQQLTHDYMRHIVSHLAAERMKHVKQYLGEVLSNYRAGGPVRREYPHDAGMAGKTKATTKGSPVEIKEIKRITNYAMSVAGGQGYQPGGRFLVAFNRRGYFSTKASRANRVGLVSGCGLSNNLLCRCAFSRCRSSMDNAISCSSSFVIVCTCKAVRRNTPRYSDDGFCCCNLLRWFFLPLRNTSSGGGSLVFSGGVNFSFLVSMMARISRWRCSALIFGVTGENLCLLILDSGNALYRDASYHGAGYCLVRCLSFWYPSFLEGYVNIFRTNFSRNTSDHLSKKAAYTEAIPYKTGIGRENPFNCKAINDARSVFFSASVLRHINGVVYCAYSCTIQSFHELHFAQRHQQTMVMLAGLPKGRPESLQSGFLTPASVTALCERENSCGDVIHHCKEAANMATTPALVHSQTAFIWRFIIFGASESQIIHVTAWTEREARNRCPSGCVAVFAARIRQEASHG
ncbi:host cell division inhibitor Icd-like protein [Escherichia coli]